MRPQSSSSIHAAPPAAIGRYRILTRIASGGMGAVFLAETDWVPGSPAQRVALKVLHAHHGEDEEITSRFVDEGRVASRIVHPNVVKVLDAGKTEEYAFLALEYIHGETLSGLLRAANAGARPFPLGVVSAIVCGFLEGLHAAHEATDDGGTPLGLVHRDVSPQNILIGLDGQVLVTDFGVAKVKDRIRATRSGAMIGKTGYMAPEQVAGGIVSAKTDLYAAGIVLWECLALAKLFDGLEAQIQAAVTKKPPPSVCARRSEVPEAVDELLRELLHHAPDHRPENALVVARRLAELLPPASLDEVGAFVTELAGARLEERERRAQQSILLSVASEDRASTSGAGSLPDPPEAAETQAEVVAPVVRPSKRRAGLAAVAVAALVAGIVLSIVGFAPRGHAVAVSNPMRTKLEPLPSAEPVLPSITSSPSASAPSIASADAPAVAVVHDEKPKPTKPTGDKPKPTSDKPTSDKPAKPAGGGSCSPPYVVENGIKRYKAECFGGAK